MVNKHVKLSALKQHDKEIKGRFVKKVDLEEVQMEGIVVDPSFDFLFEGKNNEYDERYKDYI